MSADVNIVNQPISQDFSPVFNFQQTLFNLSNLGIFNKDLTDNSAKTQDLLLVPNLNNKPIKGEAKFKGVLSKFPSYLRSFNNKATYYFRFATKANFITKVNKSYIYYYIKKFNTIQCKFNSLYKSAVSVNTYPTFTSLEQQISIIY